MKNSRAEQKPNWLSLLSDYGVYIALLVLCIVAVILSSGKFITPNNIFNVLRNASALGILSIGMFMVILTGGIDLSVTSVILITACVFADFSKRMAAAGGADLSFLLLLLMLAIGSAVGLVNGLIIVLRRVEPFIITLGMMTLVKGLTMFITNGSPTGQITQAVKDFGNEAFLSIPYPVLLFIAVIAVFAVLLYSTTFGRYLYAIGGNAEAARLSGIKEKKYKIITYALSGLLSGLAGFVLISRVGVANMNLGTKYDMDAIAAVVIGGTSMAGGIGSLGGAIAGVLIISVMNNMLVLANSSPYIQDLIKGAIIIVAVMLQRKK